MLLRRVTKFEARQRFRNESLKTRRPRAPLDLLLQQTKPVRPPYWGPAKGEHAAGTQLAPPLGPQRCARSSSPAAGKGSEGFLPTQSARFGDSEHFPSPASLRAEGKVYSFHFQASPTVTLKFT